MATDNVDLMRAMNRELIEHQRWVKLNNSYYNADKTVRALGVAIPPELEAFQTVLAYCRLVCTVYEERLDFQEIRLPGDKEQTARFKRWSDLNSLPEKASLAHTEALATGHSFIVAGARPPGDPLADVPLFTVESAQNMTVRIDPRTGEVLAAFRLYGRSPHWRATLYLPNSTEYFVYRSGNGGWQPDPETPPRNHNWGVVPVVPLVNRARIDEPFGRPEFEDIKELQDAATRSLTGLQGAQELLAVPARMIFGARKEDFKNEAGELINAMETYYGSISVFSNPDAKAVEFAGAQLTNFTSTLSYYARSAAALMGIPLSYFGVVSEANPASGDAIQGDEARMNKRAERIGRGFKPAWERAFRIGARIVDGEWDPRLAALQFVFRDPATNTMAQLADAAVKLYAAENAKEGALFTREYIWQYMGLDEETREELRTGFQDSTLASLLMSDGGTPPTQGAA